MGVHAQIFTLPPACAHLYDANSCSYSICLYLYVDYLDSDNELNDILDNTKTQLEDTIGEKSITKHKNSISNLPEAFHHSVNTLATLGMCPMFSSKFQKFTYCEARRAELRMRAKRASEFYYTYLCIYTQFYHTYVRRAKRASEFYYTCSEARSAELRMRAKLSIRLLSYKRLRREAH